VIQVIESTIADQGGNNQPYTFDIFSKRLATGLIQDLANVLQMKMVEHLDCITAILFTILRDNLIQTEVKIFGIAALGDICLMTETHFLPYFG